MMERRPSSYYFERQKATCPRGLDDRSVGLLTEAWHRPLCLVARRDVV
jgi:hypothetical protein